MVSPEINKSAAWTSGATGSAGVSAGDPDGGAGGAGYARLGAWIRVGDDGRVKNCARYARDDTKSSVESEVTQSWVVCSLGGDESAGAGTGSRGVSTEGPDDAMNEIEDWMTVLEKVLSAGSVANHNLPDIHLAVSYTHLTLPTKA